MSALRVIDLSIGFRSSAGLVTVVDKVSFEIPPASCTALVGESGSGKSLTALGLMRLLPVSGEILSGEAFLGERDLLTLDRRAMQKARGRDVAMIFQDPMTSLNPVQKIGDQLAEVLAIHEHTSKKAGRARARELLGKVGLPDPDARLDAYPHQLSGGQKQRVAIAMALMLSPRVLFLDEPTTALDVTIQTQILQLLRDLMADFGVALLLITHDLGVVHQIADHVLVMYAGRIVESAPRAEFLAKPLHPYAVGLMNALPGRALASGRLYEIQGSVPTPLHYPEGCRFSPRCPLRVAVCDVSPELLEKEPGRKAACHRVEART